MLDNLRDQATFTDDEPLESEAPKPPKRRTPRRGFDQITGTTAQQRFILAVMLFIVVCLVGTVILFITNRILLPF
jgi:hypothetical protein